MLSSPADYEESAGSDSDGSDNSSILLDAERQKEVAPFQFEEEDWEEQLRNLLEDQPEDDLSMFDMVTMTSSLSESLLKDMDDTVESNVFRARHDPDPALMAYATTINGSQALSQPRRSRALEGVHGTASLLLQLMEKHGMSRACRADILNFLRLPGLDLASLPQTQTCEQERC